MTRMLLCSASRKLGGWWENTLWNTDHPGRRAKLHPGSCQSMWWRIWKIILQVVPTRNEIHYWARGCTSSLFFTVRAGPFTYKGYESWSSYLPTTARDGVNLAFLFQKRWERKSKQAAKRGQDKSASVFLHLRRTTVHEDYFHGKQ